MKALASIFTGKGGTTNLVVVSLVMIGLVNMVIENKYQVSGKLKNDGSFSLKPADTKDEECNQNVPEGEPAYDGAKE